MIKALLTVAVVLGVAALPAASAPAGICCAPPPALAWSPDGRSLAVAYGALHVVGAGGGEARALVPAGAGMQVGDVRWSPDGRSIAFTAGGVVQVVDVASAAARTIASGNGPSWSPDSTRLAYTAAPPGGPVVVVADADGAAARTIGRGIAPEWSPNGARIAFARDGVLYTVRPDGTDERRIRDGVDPLWSPDGSAITAETDGALTIARPDGRVIRVVRNAAALGWSPDGRSLAVATETGAFEVDVATGRLVRISQEGTVTPAPGLRLFAVAVTAGQTHDVYIVGRSDGAARLVDLARCSGPPCRAGTDGADRITGSQERDVLFPGAGDDTVLARGGHDRVDAAFGNDLLDGGAGNDVLLGQAGGDRLLGGPGIDILTGGGGADVLDAGGGNDLVVAERDGYRDTIRCGPGRDRVHADPADRVARDCERVVRVRT